MLLLLDKTGSNETAKVEGEGRGRHAKSRLQFPYRQAVAARLNQQADNLQAGRVSEFGEATRGNIDVHPEIIISLDADCNYNSGYVVGMRLKDRKSAVASAPGVAGVRVWHLMSRGRGHGGSNRCRRSFVLPILFRRRRLLHGPLALVDAPSGATLGLRVSARRSCSGAGINAFLKPPARWIGPSGGNTHG